MAQAEADKLRMFGEAEATKMERVAQAEAERTARVGIAEAVAIEEQVRAYGGARLRVAERVLARFAEAIEHAGVDVVPRVVMNSGAQGDGMKGGSSNLLESLVALTLSEKLGELEKKEVSPKSPEAERITRELRATLEHGATRPGAGRRRRCFPR
jgi:hypothetical protein